MAAYLPRMSQSADPAAAARDALAAFLRSTPADWQHTAPGLMSGVDAQKAEQSLAKAWQQIGAFVSVSGGGERLTIHGTRGSMPVWARADNSGLLSGLLLGEPLGRGASTAGKHWRARSAFPYFWWAFVLVGATAFCWLASSGLSWLGCAAVAAALGVLMYGLAIPDPLVMPRRVRLAAGAVGVTAAASAFRVVTLPAGTWGSAAVGVLSLVLALIGLAWVRFDWPRETVQAVMIFPLTEGTWQVSVGGGRGFLNPHAAAAEQRGALDIVRAGKNGARVTGWFPSDVRAFAAYGCTVVAPCDGTVLRAVDAYPDQIPFQPWPGPAAGNHVRIGTSTEEVLLAHLRPGSVQVARGDLVRRGQVIGQVGNSGNSTEPHLHIHAERNGAGLRLRFEGIERLSRGTRIKVTTTPAAAPGADGRSTTDPLPGP
jgi:hypothetical protein